MARAVNVSLPTLRKAEKGDPTVAFGVYVSILDYFGLVGRFADLADARHDVIGLELENQQLPKRVGVKKQNMERRGAKK